MSDIFYPALVSFVTIALGLAPGLWPERFRRRPYQITAVICAILLGLGTYAVMDHDRRKAEDQRQQDQRKAAVEREGVIQETSVRVSAELTKQYANTVSSQAQKIGELEGYIQSQGKDVRDVKKYTVAIWQRDQTDEQKKQEVKENLDRYIGMNNFVLGPCGQVGPPGHGGTSPQVCIDSSREWKSITLGYISGSLGKLYVDRFVKAGVRRGDEAPPTGIGVDTNLDPYTRSEVVWAMYELKAKADVLREFIRELGQ
jgi:hypothetical protein